jgi:type IV pilus assembly protein PilB
MPKKIIPAVTARFKIIAELDIAERRVPGWPGEADISGP